MPTQLNGNYSLTEADEHRTIYVHDPNGHPIGQVIQYQGGGFQVIPMIDGLRYPQGKPIPAKSIEAGLAMLIEEHKDPTGPTKKLTLKEVVFGVFVVAWKWFWSLWSTD